ncbi:MAG: PilZ domain-containing protein [Candidatus Omnitrophica bacterium]|jgi:hypothetical protein|nr:PilZ domain-containing protein [Candidatus Omnitrophota bacterium]
MYPPDHERRNFLRVQGRFIVSYRPVETSDKIDVSQTHNLSRGGICFTTNRKFFPKEKLQMEVRLPNRPEPVTVFAQVVDSQEIIQGMVYNTHAKFLFLKSEDEEVIKKLVEFISRRSNLS